MVRAMAVNKSLAKKKKSSSISVLINFFPRAAPQQQYASIIPFKDELEWNKTVWLCVREITGRIMPAVDGWRNDVLANRALRNQANAERMRAKVKKTVFFPFVCHFWARPRMDTLLSTVTPLTWIAVPLTHTQPRILLLSTVHLFDASGSSHPNTPFFYFSLSSQKHAIHRLIISDT